MSQLLAIVIVLLIVAIVFWRRQESFDVYADHTDITQKLYAVSDDVNKLAAAGSGPATERLAKYTWTERNRNGVQLYDKVYQTLLNDNAYRNVANGYSVASMTEQDPLFTVVNGERITLSQKTY
jgi:hypothetical protein